MGTTRSVEWRLGLQITLTLPNEAASVPLAWRTLAAALNAAGVTPDSMDEVALALTEACANVVRHAGESDDYDVVIDISDERLAVEVTDTGRGFARRRPPPTPTMPAGFSEDGRGAALMRAFTDMGAPGGPVTVGWRRVGAKSGRP